MESQKLEMKLKTFLLTQKHRPLLRNHDNVSVSFPARKPKIELEIALKTLDMLKATYF